MLKEPGDRRSDNPISQTRLLRSERLSDVHSWEVTSEARLLQTHSHLPALSTRCPAHLFRGFPWIIQPPPNFLLRKNCANSFLCPTLQSPLTAATTQEPVEYEMPFPSRTYQRETGVPTTSPGVSPIAHWRNRRPPVSWTSGTAPELLHLTLVRMSRALQEPAAVWKRA